MSKWINKFWSSQEYVIEIRLPGFLGKINKRYNDFLAFNEALLTKFKNLDFPEFPSKFQLVNRKETRKDKFTTLFDKIIHYAKEFPELKEKLLSMLYTFLVVQCKTMYFDAKKRDEPDSDKRKSLISKRTKLMNMLTKGFKKQNGAKLHRRKSHDLSTSKNNLTDEDHIHIYSAKKKGKRDKTDKPLAMERRGSDNQVLKKVSDILAASPEKPEHHEVPENLDIEDLIEENLDESNENLEKALNLEKPEQVFPSVL